MNLELLSGISTYVIKELLYSGNKCFIYRGEKEKDHLSVILKILKTTPPSLQDIHQLKHEFDVYQKLMEGDLSCVVKAYALENLNDNPLLVLEDFSGETLRSYLTREKEIDFRKNLMIATLLAKSMGDIHQLHVTHKALNPSNILLNPKTGQIKIIDFGNASFFSREMQSVSHLIEGEIAYLSPEQCGRLDKTIDYRADIYSLGVILYELFTRQLPFHAKEVKDLFHFHLTQDPMPPSQVNSTIPKTISDIIMKCLAKEAENRYHTAYSLFNDLKKCLDQYAGKGQIDIFEPAQQDSFIDFHIPQKLYGREKEKETLLQTIERISKGNAECVLISGESGVGKTSLVYDIQTITEQKRGLFISGKFDSAHKNFPYYGIIQAFQKLVQLLLLENDRTLSKWKDKILAALEGNVPLICKVIPELMWIVGEQPDLQEVNFYHQKARFEAAFHSFIQLFLRPEHFLVIFLDDIEYADTASLELIQSLMSRPYKHLLFIGTYERDDLNLNIPHTVIKTQLSLSPLTFEMTESLIKEVFNLKNEEQLIFLTQTLYEKTKGNPFFTILLLRFLYHQKAVSLKPEGWIIHFNQIEKLLEFDSLIIFLKKRVSDMPPLLLNLLKAGVIIGNSFSIDLLSLVLDIPKDKIAEQLQTACQEDWILQEQETPSFFSQYEKSRFTAPFRYIFQHDLIREAIYQMINPEEQAYLEDKVGKMYLNRISNDKFFIFSAADHLNHVIPLIHKTEEKLLLAQLNLRAGELAMKIAAFHSASDYFENALKLLGEDWKDTSLLFTLNKNLALCRIHTKSIEAAEKSFESTLKYSQNDEERAEIFLLKSKFYTKIDRYEDAFQLSVEGLLFLNINLPPLTSKWTFWIELWKVKKNLFLIGPQSLIQKPRLQNPRKLLEHSLYMSLVHPLFMLNKHQRLIYWIVLKVIQLSFKEGVTQNSAQALSLYSLFLLSEHQNKYEQARECAIAAMEIEKQFDGFESFSKFIFYGFIEPFQQPLKENSKSLRDLFHLAMRQGNIFIGLNALFLRLNDLFLSGDTLERVEEESRKSHDLASSFSYPFGISWSHEFSELVRALKGLTNDPIDHDLKIGEPIFSLLSAREKQALEFLYQVHHLQLLLLYEKVEEAYEWVNKELNKNREAIWPKNILFIHADFLYALCLIELCTKEKNKKYLNSFEDLLKNIEKQVETFTYFLPHYYLLKAKKHQYLGKNEDAIEMYEKAGVEAKKNELLYLDAMICEFASRFYLKIEQRKVSSFYMQEAYEIYLKWGAEAKAASLLENFPELINGKVIAAQTLTKSMDGFKTGSLRTTLANSTMTELELSTFIQASQSISQEIALEKLIAKLMHITLADAGADRSFLILKENDQLWVVAQILLGEEKATMFNHLSLEAKKNDLCLAVVYYVARSLKELNLNDAMHAGHYTQDPYIKEHQPQSILCIPLIDRGMLIGLLYLENHATKGAFNARHVHLLSLISSQMAISIHNSYLYAHLEAKVEERAKKIEEMQIQLMQQDKLASLGLLTAGIAHEIKNPLNFVINFSHLSQDILSELNEHIKKKNIYDLNQTDLKTFSDNLKMLQDNVNTIFEQGNRADSIIQRMLAHSRTKATQMTWIDLHSLLEEYIALSFHGRRAQYSKTFNVKIEKDFDPSLKLVEIVPEDIGRVVLNLLQNAYATLIEKQQEQGLDFQQKILIKTKNKGLEFEISIRDNGKGIPSQYIEKIFTPFFTTKAPNEGTGLGLSLSHNIIVQEHHGTLTFETKEGEYTEFKITLPIRSKG